MKFFALPTNILNISIFEIFEMIKEHFLKVYLMFNDGFLGHFGKLNIMAKKAKFSQTIASLAKKAKV
jgi:hypothetical protein